MKRLLIAGLAVVTILAMMGCGAKKEDAEYEEAMTTHEMGSQQTASAEKGIPQTTCPVMGGKINRDVYADYEGMRIYFCCPGCEKEFAKDPEKYIKMLEDQGVTLEKSPMMEEEDFEDEP